MQKLVEEFLYTNPGYLKKSPAKVASRLKLDCNYETLAYVANIMKKVRKHGFSNNHINTNQKQPNNINFVQSYPFYQPDYEYTYNFTFSESNTKEETNNVLIIGDIHEPFSKEGYLEFCKEQYDKFNCNKVVFIGDIIDQAFSSFHPTNPDGYGAGDELDRAIDKIQNWYKVFPEATVIIGNHDRLAYRKAFAGGISARWLRNYDDVLGTPGWEFKESEVIDNVLYIHGEAGTARSKAKDISQSVVQGHLHSQAYVEYINNRVFAMQVGTGVDDSCYAFNYNKAGKESILSCGIVLEGKQPLLIKM
jgi:predicted phosphodiesterase